MSQVKITNTTPATIQVPGRAGIRVPGRLSVQVNTNCIDRGRAAAIFGLRIEDVLEHVGDGQPGRIPVQSTVILNVPEHVADPPTGSPTIDAEAPVGSPADAMPVEDAADAGEAPAGPPRRRGRRRKSEVIDG